MHEQIHAEKNTPAARKHCSNTHVHKKPDALEPADEHNRQHIQPLECTQTHKNIYIYRKRGEESREWRRSRAEENLPRKRTARESYVRITGKR